MPSPAWLWAGLLGAALSVAAQIGDLVASTLKRWAQVKDSGTLLPEFGGGLDLTDGLLLAIPLLAAIIVAATLGPGLLAL